MPLVVLVFAVQSKIVTARATEQPKTVEAPSNNKAAGFKRMDEIHTVTRLTMFTTLPKLQRFASKTIKGSICPHKPMGTKSKLCWL
jgi:hypothetical protein